MLVAELMTVRCHVSQCTFVLCGGQDEEAHVELMAWEQDKETRYQRRGCTLSDFGTCHPPCPIFKVRTEMYNSHPGRNSCSDLFKK